MFRATLDPDSANASALVTAAKGVAFQRRQATAGSSVTTSGSTTSAFPHWVRLDRAGDLFTAYESGDGATWTVIGTDTVVMPQTLYVGLAVSSHNNTTATTSKVTGVSVQ